MGDDRLERLLGRLGSEPGATGEPAGAALIEATSPPRPEPPAAARRPAEDPADAVLNEIYPPAAEPA
ncbi:MAG TPA: hypothetical protein VMF86_14735, partial [Stellaceae bacterium]|nr:hypothetical protein [Stellaceae bacterium]